MSREPSRDRSPLAEHLFRRAGFGLAPAERDNVAQARGYRDLVESLLVFNPLSANIDDAIGTPGYVGITSRTGFAPDRDINDARQRWLFRAVHAPAPLRDSSPGSGARGSR